MKVANLVELLAAYVELLRDTRAKSQADAMQALGDALRTSASLQVKAAAERLMVGLRRLRKLEMR